MSIDTERLLVPVPDAAAVEPQHTYSVDITPLVGLRRRERED